jgi:hypothetical protein
VRDFAKIRFVLPPGWRMCAARAGIGRADNRIGVGEQDINIRKRVWYGFSQRRFLGAKVPARVGAQLVAQRFTPSGEKVGEFGAGERSGCLEEIITKTASRKPMRDSRSAARETGRMIVATREKTNENETATSKLDRWVCEDVDRSIYDRVVTVLTTVRVLGGVLVVAREIYARARLENEWWE